MASSCSSICYGHSLLCVENIYHHHLVSICHHFFLAVLKCFCNFPLGNDPVPNTTLSARSKTRPKQRMHHQWREIKRLLERRPERGGDTINVKKKKKKKGEKKADIVLNFVHTAELWIKTCEPAYLRIKSCMLQRPAMPHAVMCPQRAQKLPRRPDSSTENRPETRHHHATYVQTTEKKPVCRHSKSSGLLTGDILVGLS